MKSSNSTNVVKINPRDPNLVRLREVARATREGKIVGFPTETVYGIGGPMSMPDINQRLASLKGRDEGKPFSFHIGEWEMADYLRVKRTPAFGYLARTFWPGPLTLIVPTEDGQTIGIRYPRNLLAMALINATGEPFVATSANRSGSQSPKTAEDVLGAMDGKIDFLIDGGTCELSQDSTVVSLTDPQKPEILREGAMAEEIREAVEKIRSGKFPRKKILVVCTGNSCRSPMAEGWLQSELRRKRLDEEIEVSSCGVGARPGASATMEAVYVMGNREVDISNHRARLCTREDVMNADLIIAMSEQHSMFITGMVPVVKNRVIVFNVVDPIGMSMTVYEDVMTVIEKRMRENWETIIA